MTCDCKFWHLAKEFPHDACVNCFVCDSSLNFQFYFYVCLFVCLFVCLIVSPMYLISLLMTDNREMLAQLRHSIFKKKNAFLHKQPVKDLNYFNSRNISIIIARCILKTNINKKNIVVGMFSVWYFFWEGVEAF
jgi:hypothetical protein